PHRPVARYRLVRCSRSPLASPVLALCSPRFAGVHYLGRQLHQPEFLLAGRDLPLHTRRENRSSAALRGRCAGESTMRRELQRPALVSLPFLSSNRSPLQTTVCRTKLDVQTSSATMSLSGNSGSIVTACRSRNTL